MIKICGWILTILGGLLCFVSAASAPIVLFAGGGLLSARIVYAVVYLAMCAAGFFICRKGLALKQSAFARESKNKAAPASPEEELMTSQLPALYLKRGESSYRTAYISRLTSLGISRGNAEKLFQFECSVIRRFDKPYLLDRRFTQSWFFGLSQPFFQAYPKSKEDILKEKSLTVSELCKLIDEAEWHFWNSHEKKLTDDVWAEICQWRLRGPGAEFAVSYFEAIAKDAGVPMDSLAPLSSEQGAHLERYKWS